MHEYFKKNQRGGASSLSRYSAELGTIAYKTYNSNMKKYSFRKGFTLAEVLITLAIVGIVAALTIPTLVNKIQEAHFHAKWKECYALLNNSFKMVVAENPRMVVSDVDSFFPTSDFIEAILKHLYVEDTCGISNAYDSKICDAYYRKPYWVGTYNIYSYYKTLSGSTLNAYDFCNKAALLRNGAVVYIGGLWSR